MIQVNNLHFQQGRSPVLEKVSLTIHSNEFIGIFGPNGGGKTTLLKLLMGFLEPDRGSIALFGQSPDQTRHRIGYVPQIHRIDPDFPITLQELISLGLQSKQPLLGGFRKEDWEKAEHWMEKLSLLPHRHKAYGQLSGGLAQRALLARALISQPDLLLLDEPTSNIDAQSLAIFFRTLDELRGKKTILLVSHDLRTLVKKAERFLCVQGKVTELTSDEICGHFALGLYHAPVEKVKKLLTSSSSKEGAFS